MTTYTTTFCDACHTEILQSEPGAFYEVRLATGQIAANLPRRLDFHLVCVKGLDTNPPSAGGTVGMERAAGAS